MKHKPILLIFDHSYKRFWSKVDKKDPDDCWNWVSELNAQGYGKFMNFRTWFLAHRVSYYIVHGPIPDGMLILHKCDNRKCVNPNHLYCGTHADNISDRAERNPDGQGGTISEFSKNETDVIGQLREIGYSVEDLAKKYNVSKMTIYRQLKVC